MLLVVKRSGNVEPFDRAKVISGVRKACQGRPIDEDDLKQLGQRVEEDLRSRGLAEVRSQDVGKAILKPLRDLDEVAYLRFASVYQNFEGLGDFLDAINELQEAHATYAQSTRKGTAGSADTVSSAGSAGSARTSGSNARRSGSKPE